MQYNTAAHIVNSTQMHLTSRVQTKLAIQQTSKKYQGHRYFGCYLTLLDCSGWSHLILYKYILIQGRSITHTVTIREKVLYYYDVGYSIFRIITKNVLN